MDFLSELNSTDEILLLEDINKTEIFNKIREKFTNSKVIPEESIPSVKNESIDVVCCGLPNEKSLTLILNILKNGGRLIIINAVDKNQIKLDLIMKGFMNVKVFDNYLITNKPTFKSGSSAQLKISKKPTPAVWKLDETLDDEIETIDPDDLLDDDDLLKPDPSSLKVCGTTGKRKACKDCSCGLAEELLLEGEDGTVNTKDVPKSSCGSCYLGDAFRCASCPYLGMPAFKPGEKIQLAGNQLQADI